jgi:hypothetical protein
MAKLAPLSAGELDHELGALRPSVGADLRDLHALLMRATPLLNEPPSATLVEAGDLVAALPGEVVDGLPPRPRTVFRLLLAGAVDAAWAVLIDNATGVVAEPLNASTSSGATRKAWRLPLLTRIEPPRVFADLPGFRDPRFGAPDDCYDITAGVRLRHHLDEVRIEGGIATFGGWAALDPLVTGPSEGVRLIASNGDVEVAALGCRLRRADLVTGKADATERRTWAGWSTRLDLADPRLVVGAWTLSLEVDHDGVSRRVPLGTSAGELARAATSNVTRVGARSVRWKTSGSRWGLVVVAG